MKIDVRKLMDVLDMYRATQMTGSADPCIDINISDTIKFEWKHKVGQDDITIHMEYLGEE